MRYLFTVLLLLVCAAATGCTHAGNTYVTDIVKGESIPGETAGYIYNFSKKGNSDSYLLTKRKFCFEEMEKLAYERKRTQDVRGAAATVLAPIGIIFPRVGQPLVMRGFEKSRGKTIEKIGTMNTGRIMPCGEDEPAAHEAIILMTSDMEMVRDITSDADGIIRLNKDIAKVDNAFYVNVFIEHEESVYFVGTNYME